MLDPLILVRFVHIAATVLAAGTVGFVALVAEPAASAVTRPADFTALRERLIVVVFIALAVAMLSGAVWLLLVAADIYGASIVEVYLRGDVASVLTDTRFGQVALARLMLALLLGALLPWPGTQYLQLAVAAVLIALLALIGHAGATPGLAGRVHLATDIVHLLGASAWLGGLLPFVFLLSFAGRSAGGNWATASVVATRRFSILGILSVGALLVTGIISTWNLVGSIHALTSTDYGRLLLLKIGLFAAMIYLASVNRLRLTPRLPAPGALHRLQRNSMAEIGLGLCIVVIVGALGSISPAIHSHVHAADPSTLPGQMPP